MAFRVHVRQYFCFHAALWAGTQGSELGVGSSNVVFVVVGAKPDVIEE